MKDRISAVVSYVSTFPTTRVDKLVPFLSSVYHLCSHDDFPLKKTIKCLQQLIAIPQPVTPLVRRASGADILATPVKAMSASLYGLLSTLDDVTPRLESELKRYIWFSEVGNMSFFDHFFPEINDPPAPKPFPDNPHQNDVIDWIEAYDEECREVMELGNCRRFLETPANQPPSHTVRIMGVRR